MNDDAIEPALDAAIVAVSTAAIGIGASVRDATRGVLDTATALDALNAAESANDSRAVGDRSRDTMLSLRAARADLLAFQLGRQRSMLAELTECLARLRAAMTLDDLVESIPIETSGLGYERVMFSWIENEFWVPRSAYCASGAMEANALLDAGRQPYVSTRELMEVDVVRKRRPILVLDAKTNPRVHPKISPVSLSTTYTAAPVVARNHVAAILHVDRNIETGQTDEFDRDLLGLFAQSVGVMLDRLLESDDTVRRALPPAATTNWIEVLTVREREVLRLMAEGSTNAQIGARLFISEETTKTHVKKLMRKMGVHNRSQAGAMYHRQLSGSA
ncbi:helix-turn-helix transcriptional regulator [Rhodococcoides kyotonense]|uniref:Regulatory protein, luxR family n=1 Tax=Rhodococcoides kyotonense TaxID=398843 RepID=A0A239K415_9NOCA|nr:LuxR C-terminal-related transcriptional regulator [Rhodococcus kyotonensis]SNT12741.1 regulatory protein, luxR family [Rhodococcus kyotonensis]